MCQNAAHTVVRESQHLFGGTGKGLPEAGPRSSKGNLYRLILGKRHQRDTKIISLNVLVSVLSWFSYVGTTFSTLVEFCWHDERVGRAQGRVLDEERRA